MADDNTHTRGAVKDPEHDGRLKGNRETGTGKGTSHESKSGAHDSKGASHDSAAHAASSEHTQGAVKDPKHDGRLKENREKGIHKSDA